MPYLGIASLLIVLATAMRWLQLAWRVNIPRDPTVFQLLWGIGLTVGLVALYLGASTGFAVTAIVIGLLLLFLSFTGEQRIEGHTVNVGDSIPSFSGVDETGTPLEGKSLRGSRVLLKFFRGHW